MGTLFITFWTAYTIFSIIGLRIYFQKVVDSNRGLDVIIMIAWLFCLFIGIYTCLDYFGL